MFPEAISDNSPQGGVGPTSPNHTYRVMKLIKNRNNSVGMSDSEKIGEIEKMIIFKKSTLTGAFFFDMASCNISKKQPA